MKAYFFDRDGTIIKDKHYLSDPNEVEFYPASFRLLKRIQEKGHKCFIVTNQSGVGRGYFPISDILKIHQKMDAILAKQGLRPFHEYVFCPHAPEDNCPCRKPKPAMILDLIKRWELVPSQCLMIGDKESDYHAGINAGIKSLLLGKHQSIPSIDSLDLLEIH